MNCLTFGGQWMTFWLIFFNLKLIIINAEEAIMFILYLKLLSVALIFQVIRVLLLYGCMDKDKEDILYLNQV